MPPPAIALHSNMGRSRTPSVIEAGPGGGRPRTPHSAFRSAPSQVMGERIGSRSSNIRVPLHVPIGVEQWARIATFPCARPDIMDQRISPRLSQLRILLQVPARVEQRVRVKSEPGSV